MIAVVLMAALQAQSMPLPVVRFERTQDSDEWVGKSIRVQRRYRRVLLVDAGSAPAKTVPVPALDLNARAPVGEGPPQKVDRVFRTLQAAAEAARGGDLVAVAPGRYAGFVLEDKRDAADERYVHFRALGAPGAVVIDRPGPDEHWMVLFRAAHHAILEGFAIAGPNAEGQPPSGPWAGIMLDGDFGRTGKLAHHIVLAGNFSHHHRKWGFHSTDTHTVLIQDNLFAFSAQEHGGYASDGSDNYVIRRNVFFGNRAGGLQCNLDTVSSFHEVLKHPALRGFPPEQPTRAWARSLVARANALFGGRHYPDGKGENFIIEDNVMNGNGRGGGGSLNLASLQDSLIQNNLIYGNANHGIAQWDDGNPYDAATAVPGPTTVAEMRAENIPWWGCQRNVVRNNTVLMANPARAGLQARNGSWGMHARNNVVINDGGAAIEIFNTSIGRLDSGWNVAGKLAYVMGGEGERLPMPDELKTLATGLDEGRSKLGLTRAQVAPAFVRDGQEPWVLIENGWWRLNPARPDFRPRAGGILAGQGDPRETPPRDLTGRRRSGSDVGAFAAE